MAREFLPAAENEPTMGKAFGLSIGCGRIAFSFFTGEAVCPFFYVKKSHTGGSR